MSSIFKKSLTFTQLVLVIFLPPLITVFLGLDLYAQLNPVINTSLINGFSFVIALWIFKKLKLHPQKRPSLFILPITLTVYAFFLAILVFFRFHYSLKILSIGFLITPLFLAIFYVFDTHRILRLFYVPFGEVENLKSNRFIKFKPLYEPVLPKTFFDGVVVDFKAYILSPEWERFLSECALKKIHIYNYLQLQEAITGQVNVKHLAENNFGELAPSEFVMLVKRIIDICFLILTAPLVIPLMVVIGIFVVIETNGGVFYIQERMGLGGSYFKLIKFRSMTIDNQDSSSAIRDETQRITNVGKFIRRYRLDELPQFWNVLRGEMSLIGPRPESVKLAQWYQKDIPFFMYRHVVRPGISGWAQVMHGYALGIDETKEKISYDFYYIKHFSLWLDLLIWYKTIKTVFTGFGSR